MRSMTIISNLSVLLAALVITLSSCSTPWSGGSSTKVSDHAKPVYEKDAALAKEFFCEWVSFNARIDSNFRGLFFLRFDASLPYTHKSRYLKDICFTGGSDCSVRLNGYDNVISGNGGWNKVYLSGSSSDYVLTSSGGVSILEDTIEGRDGRNTLSGVEELVFSDRSVRL